MPPLALVGNLSFDLVDGSAPQIGGGPIHCGRAIRTLGARATILARCGREDERTFRQGFAKLGLPVDVLLGQRTTTFAISYEGDLRTMGVEQMGDVWRPDDVGEVPPGAWVHLAPLLRGDFPPETLALLARGRRISFDGQGLTRPRRVGPLRLEGDPDPDVLRNVSILKLAEEEAVALAGGIDTDALTALGPPEVVVTFGSRGSLVVANGRRTEVRARRIDVDPTGSGDGFAAGYLASRAAGLGPVAAARRATALVSAILSERLR